MAYGTCTRTPGCPPHSPPTSSTSWRLSHLNLLWQAYSAVLAAEREGARHERQLAAEGAARNELAESLGQSERSARELSELLAQQHAVRAPCCARSTGRELCKGSRGTGRLDS